MEEEEYQPDLENYDPNLVCRCFINKPLRDEPQEIPIPARKLRVLTTVTRTENYLRERRIPELIRFLLTKVTAQAPERPMEFLEKLLDDCMLFRAGHGSPPVIYEDRHLEAVVKSFDPGERGWLTEGQLRRALSTMGLPSPDCLEERSSNESVLNFLKRIQETELFNLLSAGTETVQIQIQSSNTNSVSGDDSVFGSIQK